MWQRGLPSPAGRRACLPAGAASQGAAAQPRVSLPAAGDARPPSDRSDPTCWDLPSAASPAERAPCAVTLLRFISVCVGLRTSPWLGSGGRSAGIWRFAVAPGLKRAPKAGRREGAERCLARSVPPQHRTSVAKAVEGFTQRPRCTCRRFWPKNRTGETWLTSYLSPRTRIKKPSALSALHCVGILQRNRSKSTLLEESPPLSEAGREGGRLDAPSPRHRDEGI